MNVKSVLIIEGLVNISMIIVKLIVGISTGSAAITADALHSFTDLINNVVAFFAIRITEKPADDDHHYGHQKFEQLAVFFLATLLCVVAIEVVVSAVSRVDEVVEQSTAGLIVLVIALMVNLVLSWWERRWAKRLNSELLSADSSHTFSDVLTSIAAIVGWQLSTTGLYWIDTVFALIVAVMICILAYRLFAKAVPILVDHSEFSHALIKRRINNIEEVLSIPELRIRSVGKKHFAVVTIMVKPEMSLLESHDIAEQVEGVLAREFDIQDTNVHIEPKGAN